jgi:hypothetical protein
MPVLGRVGLLASAVGFAACSSGAGGIKPLAASFGGSGVEADGGDGSGGGRSGKKSRSSADALDGNSGLVDNGSGRVQPTASVQDASEIDRLITDHAAKNPGRNVLYARIDHLSHDKSQTAELNVVRFGLTKVLNSVSTSPQIVKLNAIDDAQTVFRINMDEYAQAGAVSRLGSAAFAQQNMQQIGGATVVKGDWLVYALSRPEVYDYLLRLPQLGRMLEATLRVDYNQAKYVNTDRSDVTFDGRVLMRMPLEIGGKPGGYYWRSYDFGRKDVLQRGFADPKSLRTTAIPDLVAGEIIYSLPNGMQAYYLIGFGDQHRFDVPAGGISGGTPTLPVATDMRRPQDGLRNCVGGKAPCGYVINGESCMSCHSAGVNAPTNAVGTHGASLEEMNAYIRQDRERFTGALSEMGYPDVSEEPILSTCRIFLADRAVSDKRNQASEVPGLIGR